MDYVEVVDGLTLHPTDSSTSVMLLAAAASYDGVRLIDNIELFIEADPQGAQG